MAHVYGRRRLTCPVYFYVFFWSLYNMCSTDPFDVDRLRIPDTGNLVPWGVKRQTPCQPQRPRIPRHKPGELFLKGPIPWRWLVLAGQLPGRALAVGVLLWHLVGIQNRGTVRLLPSKTRSLGLSPRAARRGLTALEGAGLVAVDRHRGRSPDVTVLDAPLADEMPSDPVD